MACGWSRWPSRRVAQASDERRMSAPAKEIQRCIAARLPQRLRNASRTRPVLWRHKMCSRQRPMKQTDDWAVSNVARVPACTHACAAPRLRSTDHAARAARFATLSRQCSVYSDPCRCGRDPRRPNGADSARCHGTPPRPFSTENMLCGDTEFSPPPRFRFGCCRQPVCAAMALSSSTVSQRD